MNEINNHKDVTDGGLRAKVKRLIPVPLMQLIQKIWRKYYWWQKNRISPGKNKKVIDGLVSSGESIKLELGSGIRKGREDWIF